MLFPKLQCILALPCILAAVIKTPRDLLPTQTLFQVNQTGPWLENIAVRSNGDLLVTMLLPTASLYTMKTPYSPARKFSLVHTFDNATALLGITETHPDTFAILSIEFSGASSRSPTLWSASFDAGDNLRMRKVTGLEGLLVPNGITSIPGTPVVLLTDSSGGTITRCDTATGACGLILNTTQTAPVPGSAQATGANGVHYRCGYLYWSNSDLVSLFRVRLDKAGYPAPDAQIETIGTVDAAFVDDFAADGAGRFWIAAGGDNTVIALRGDGSSEVAAAVAGPTAAAFGRTARDRGTLYVVTNGQAEPAKVVAVDVSKYII
ncbi:hypothetical protein GGS24DRAFT_135264 [Hypoxylon argillaceum]|nr:hypothetical protein GGS24DRAFT_135264 [Hypoxylon argillaceum]KAI1146502.1 hypothetical protein F4825DRAFT_190978 [Nemania diffusa]